MRTSQEVAELKLPPAAGGVAYLKLPAEPNSRRPGPLPLPPGTLSGLLGLSPHTKRRRPLAWQHADSSQAVESWWRRTRRRCRHHHDRRLDLCHGRPCDCCDADGDGSGTAIAIAAAASHPTRSLEGLFPTSTNAAQRPATATITTAVTAAPTAAAAAAAAAAARGSELCHT